MPAEHVLADRLHSAAIHLLRRLRTEDDGSGLSAPRLSALSVVVFAGPITLGDLAEAEQVSPPTMSKLVGDLEKEGLVARTPDPTDGRKRRVEATPRGVELLEEGRRRRVERLSQDLTELAPSDREVLERAADLLQGLALPTSHPRQEME